MRMKGYYSLRCTIEMHESPCQKQRDDSTRRSMQLPSFSLYRALSAEGNPSFATILKVAKALGVRFHAQAVENDV